HSSNRDIGISREQLSPRLGYQKFVVQLGPRGTENIVCAFLAGIQMAYRGVAGVDVNLKQLYAAGERYAQPLVHCAASLGSASVIWYVPSANGITNFVVSPYSSAILRSAVTPVDVVQQGMQNTHISEQRESTALSQFIQNSQSPGMTQLTAIGCV